MGGVVPIGGGQDHTGNYLVRELGETLKERDLNIQQAMEQIERRVS